MHFFVPNVIVYRRNYLNLRKSRPKPASDEPAALLRTQRINFSYANLPRCVREQHVR